MSADLNLLEGQVDLIVTVVVPDNDELPSLVGCHHIRHLQTSLTLRIHSMLTASSSPPTNISLFESQIFLPEDTQLSALYRNCLPVEKQDTIFKYSRFSIKLAFRIFSAQSFRLGGGQSRCLILLLMCHTACIALRFCLNIEACVLSEVLTLSTLLSESSSLGTKAAPLAPMSTYAPLWSIENTVPTTLSPV